MKKIKIFIVVLTLMSNCLYGQYDFSKRGTAEGLILKADDICIDQQNISFEPETEEGIIKAGMIGLKYSFTYSTREIIHSFPISISLHDKFKVRVLFPWVSKSDIDEAGTKRIERGFGDLSTNFRYQIGSIKKFTIIPILWVKLPTGNTIEHSVRFPVGTGSYDVVGGVVIARRIKKLDFITSITYRMNGEFSTFVTHNRYSTKNGDSLKTFLGVDFKTPFKKISVSAKLGCGVFQEGFVIDKGIRVADRGGFTTFDVIPVLKYESTAGSSGISVSCGIPLITSLQTRISEPANREVILNFGAYISF